MVAHEPWGLDYAGSNPVTPTILNMESKPAKALGRPAKTDVRIYVLGASPMLSSI